MRALKFAKLRQGFLPALLVAALLPCAPALAAEAGVAWLRDGKIEQRSLTSGAAVVKGGNADAKVPLGSLWKLFTYSWLVQTHAEEPAYVCVSKKPAPEQDHYCCSPGESVTRDQALARSCAPYFSAARLGIAPERWQTQWGGRKIPAWLLDIKRLQPETEVTVEELLHALAAIPPEARTEARSALLDTGFKGYGRDVWTVLGTGVRYKTYSWHLADGSAYGGAAGWLADGTPFWFGARGSSRTALTTWAVPLAAALPAPRWSNASAAGDASCVDVDFFERYRLRAVWPAEQMMRVPAGDLKGRYRLEFSNGNWLSISARGDLSLAYPDGVPTISGRFTLNEYIARVVDREGNAQAPQAARALAIAARSYLRQNGRFEAGCWRIADSSKTQRVSPNPAGSAALAAAWFTDDIVLTGAPVQYHTNKAGANRMSWRDAVVYDRQGWSFERILAASYPKTSFATLTGRDECTRLAAAEDWLNGAATTWQQRLRREAGFEPLEASPKICSLAEGHPYSDQQRLRVYVRGWRSQDERITLAHEYLHLVFRFHPNGADEQYIEQLARRLING